MKKRIAIRYILIIVGITILVAGVFLFEQYYRLEISNFEAKDGQQHSYHIYPGATIDSVMLAHGDGVSEDSAIIYTGEDIDMDIIPVQVGLHTVYC